MSVRPNTTRRVRRISTMLGLASATFMVSQLALVAPANAVPGLVRIVTTGPSNSAWKTTNANCPVGTTVLGGGGFVTGAGGQVVLDTMLPLVDGDAYSVTGREDDTGYAGNWSITTTALCAPAPVSLRTITIGSGFTSNAKSVTVSCPTGKKVLGIGAEMSGGLGQVIVDDFRPNADLTSATVTGVEDGNGYASTWQLVASAKCATPPAGLVRVSGNGILDSTSQKSAAATCPAGKQVHGVGAELDGGNGRVRLTGIWASSATTVTATGAEDENGFAGSWAVRAFAICA